MSERDNDLGVATKRGPSLTSLKYLHKLYAAVSPGNLGLLEEDAEGSLGSLRDFH